MSTSRMLTGLVGGAVIGGAVSAGCGAASGAIGAAVLGASYPGAGYDTLLATQMNASGAALLGGAVGAIVGAVRGALYTDNNVNAKADGKSSGAGLLGFVAGQTISGLIGYGLFLSTATSPLVMNVGQMAASSAVGSTIFGAGATVGLLACFCCVAVCCAGAMQDDAKEAEMEEGNLATAAPRI